MRTLSSSATIVLKIFFPIFWTAFFGAFAIALWLTEEASGSVLARNLRIGILVFIVIGLILMWFSVMQLKRVEWADGSFVTTNYVKHVKYPLEALESIREIDLLLFKLVTLKLKVKSIFGRKIHFITKGTSLQSFLNDNPEVVAYLEGKIEGE